MDKSENVHIDMYPPSIPNVKHGPLAKAAGEATGDGKRGDAHPDNTNPGGQTQSAGVEIGKVHVTVYSPTITNPMYEPSAKAAGEATSDGKRGDAQPDNANRAGKTQSGGGKGKKQKATEPRLRRWDRQFPQSRDGLATWHILQPILGAGYTIGESVSNLSFKNTNVEPPVQGTAKGATPETPSSFPPVIDEPRIRMAETAAPAETTGERPSLPPVESMMTFGQGDLLLANTRAPLDDYLSNDKKPILWSDTPLEHDIFHTLRTVFLHTCSQTKVTLAQDLCKQLDKLGEDDKKKFGTGEYAFMGKDGTLKPGRELAMGFFFYAPYLLNKSDSQPRAPRYALSFGMGATENLLWVRMLRVFYPGLIKAIVKSKRFCAILGTWDPQKHPIPKRLETLAFVDTQPWPDLVMFATPELDKWIAGQDTSWRRAHIDKDTGELVW